MEWSPCWKGMPSVDHIRLGLWITDTLWLMSKCGHDGRSFSWMVQELFSLSRFTSSGIHTGCYALTNSKRKGLLFQVLVCVCSSHHASRCLHPSLHSSSSGQEAESGPYQSSCGLPLTQRLLHCCFLWREHPSLPSRKLHSGVEGLVQ